MPKSKKAAKRLAIITADMHLDDHAWADRPSLSGDSRAAFARICDMALRWGHGSSPSAHPDFCIIAAGDLVEKKRNESGPITFIRHMMDKLEGNDGLTSVPVRYVQGQHELQTEPWLNAAHRWPTHMPSERYEEQDSIGGYKIWGIDWTPPGLLQEELDKIPEGTDIVCMHQVCAAWMGDVTAPEISFDRIPHARLLIMGDYHKHVKLETRGAQGQKLTVLSPGSTNLREITGERDKKVFVLYEDLSVKVAKIPTRLVLEPPDLLMDESIEDLLEELDTRLLYAKDYAEVHELPEAIRKPIMYVRYHRRLTGTEPRLLKALNKRAHLFTKPIGAIDEDEEEGELEFDGSEEGLTLLGCLAEEVDADKEPEVFEGLQRLLSVDDPAVELTKMRKECLDAT